MFTDFIRAYRLPLAALAGVIVLSFGAHAFGRVTVPAPSPEAAFTVTCVDGTPEACNNATLSGGGLIGTRLVDVPDGMTINGETVPVWLVDGEYTLADPGETTQRTTLGWMMQITVWMLSCAFGATIGSAVAKSRRLAEERELRQMRSALDEIDLSKV